MNYQNYHQQIDSIFGFDDNKKPEAGSPSPTSSPTPTPIPSSSNPDDSSDVARELAVIQEMRTLDVPRIVSPSDIEMQGIFRNALSFAFKSKERDLRSFLRHMPHLTIMPHPTTGRNEIVSFNSEGKRIFAMDIDDRMSVKSLENLFGPQTQRILEEEVKRQDKFRKLAVAGKIAGLVISAPVRAIFSGLIAVADELGNKLPGAIKTIAQQTMSGAER